MVRFQFLLPLDESIHSETAADNAVKIAKIYNAELSTVYVIDTAIFEDKEEIRSQKKIGQNLLDKFSQYCSDKGVEIKKSNISTGSPFNEIIKMQEKIDASLIILGAPEHKVGSVAERVLRGAKCHILIARKKTAGNELYQHILVPVDGSKDAQYAAEFASSIARRSSSNLSVYHVVHNKKKMQKGVAITQKAVDIAIPKGIRTDSSVGEGDIAPEILKEIYDKSIDLTVIGYTGKGKISRLILGSVSEKVIRSAACSVFVVKSIRKEKVYTIQQ